MTTVIYRKTSPYANTQQTSWFLSNFTYRSILRDPSDILVTLDAKYQLRPDLLSYDLYSTTDYWWTFMILNPDVIIDPIYDMKVGILFYIPTKNRLLNILGG